MRLRLAVGLCAMLVTTGQAKAEPKEFFYADGWFSYCRPVLERVALKAEKPSDGEANQACIHYA